MPIPINPIDHAVCLTVPDRRVPSHWIEHIPFAMWLTSALRPRVLVELGTYSGASYCAFCQAIAALDLPTRAFAVDTWKGDPHNGPNTPEVLDDLRRHHDLRYARFSTLLQMDFDEAVSRFADKEIDLLHIDGYHTYEAVRHDFETWRSKLSDRGIIVFHDVVERFADFGVWRFWDEITAQYPSFTVLHEHGLGILAVGTDVPDEARALLDLQGPEIAPVRKVFHAMGRRLRLESELETSLAERDAFRAERDSARAQRDTHRAERDSARVERDLCRAERDVHRAERDVYRAERDSARVEREAFLAERDVYRAEWDSVRVERDRIVSSLRAAEERLATLERQWDERLASQTWRTFHQLSLVAARIGPEGTWRRRALKRVARLVEVLGREGPIGFARLQARQAIERKGRRRSRGAATDDRAADGSAADVSEGRGPVSRQTPHSHKGNSHARIH